MMGVPERSSSGKLFDSRIQVGQLVGSRFARGQRGCVSRDDLINRSLLTCNSYEYNVDTRKLHYTCSSAAGFLMWAALTH